MLILGIDIGAVVIKGGIVNTETGEIVSDRYRTPMAEDSSPQHIMSKVYEVIKFFQWKGPIGCCIPSAVINGVVTDPIHMNESWMDAEAEHLLEEITDCPVSVLNDADAAGIAEMKFGAGREKNGTVIVLTIGTGIGSAMFYNGTLIPNLELGRIEVFGTPADQTVSRKAKKDEGLKKRLWARRVQSVLNQFERMFYPELFILGGWISKKAEKITPYIDIRTPVVPAELLNEAGLIGAACYALRKTAPLETGSQAVEE